MDPRNAPPLGLPRAARLGVAAGLLGVDAQPIFERIHWLVDTEIGILAWYPTDHVGLAAAAPLERRAQVATTLRDVARGLGSAAGPADAANVAERAMVGLHAHTAPTEKLALEIGVDPQGPYAVAIVAGLSTLDEDGALVAELGVDAAAWDVLRARLVRIGGPERGERRVLVSVHAGSAPRTEVAIARVLRAADGDPLAPALALAAELGASTAQQHLVPRVHGILAKRQPAFARVATVIGRDPTPALVLEYADATLDTGLRVATGLGGDDAARRFGTFTGALAADRVLAIELALGPVDPVPARIACPVSSAVTAQPS